MERSRPSTLLLLARYGYGDSTHTLPKISQETLAECTTDLPCGIDLNRGLGTAGHSERSRR
jgi:hypothetical protein